MTDPPQAAGFPAVPAYARRVCGVLDVEDVEDVEDGAMAGGRIVTDRLGLRRALLGRAPR